MPRRIRELLVVASALCGCVTTYQPLTSLQRPVAVDPQLSNFEGVRMLIRCVPGDYLDDYDSQMLCGGVRRLFENQGARVETEVPTRGRTREAGEAKPDLIVDLSGRLLHEDNSSLLWVISALSLTIVPGITDYSFAQDVTIRDASGTVLVTDSLQGRFVRYAGVGVWAVNGILDLLVRPDAEDMTGDVYRREFSRDFYGQLTQLAFNANVRSVVLRGFETQPPPAGAGGAD